jgi:hypothetical protein
MNTSTAPAKKVVKKTAAATAAAPAVAAPVVATEAPKKTKKVAAEASATTSSAPSASVSRAGSPARSVAAPAPAPVAETPAAETTEVSLADEISQLQQSLTSLRDGATAALALLKRVSRRAQQDIKEASKRRRKQKTQEGSDAPKKPNNFQVPVPISPELAAFLKCSSTISRTEVNTLMQQFAKSNGLTKGQTIHLTPTDEMKADSSWKFNQAAATSLRKLLNCPEGETLTIFNIQKYLKHHYPKPEQKA